MRLVLFVQRTAMAGALAPLSQACALQVIIACIHTAAACIATSVHFCLVVCRSNSIRTMSASRLAPVCLLLLVCLHHAEGNEQLEQ
jgi:hypothetical protein